jgi:hypothetical protein
MPFWSFAPCWDDTNWSDFSIKRIDGKQAKDVSKFIQIIDKMKGDELFYIITDGNFDVDNFGGSSLLEKYLDNPKFMGGVIYSESICSSELVDKSNKTIELNRVDEPEKCRLIKLFFEKGSPPVEIIRSECVGELSKAIHSIQNLFLPLNADLETIRSLQHDQDSNKIIEEIVHDYFSVEPPGYLMETRIFCNVDHSYRGFEHELLRILMPCSTSNYSPTVFPETTPDYLKSILSGNNIYETDIDKLSDNIRLHKARQNFKTDLQGTLTELCEAGKVILNTLRDLRANLQHLGNTK